MSETMYNTLGNGGVMYRVFDNTEKKELRVITPEPLPENNIVNNVNHNAESELDGMVGNTSRFKSSEIRIPYSRVWIAHDPEYDEDGYEILAEISNYEDIWFYVFIGPTVTFFWTPQPIELYKSYVGSSGVPYGFAATKDYVFGFTHTEDDQVIVVSRKRIEKRLHKKTGKSLNDELAEEDLWEVTDEIMHLPFAKVHQETLHDNLNANDFLPFEQGRFQEIMNKAKLLAKRRSNYGNTHVALASRVPMNIAHQIAEFRTGLTYRPYKKNTIRNNRRNTITPIGPLPNNFHEMNVGNNTNNNNNNNNRRNRNLAVTTKNCSKKKCTIMGGKRKSSSKRLFTRKVRG